MNPEKEVPVITIESPTKKIILVGIAMIIFIIITDMLSNYFNYSIIFQNVYILYPLIGILVIVFVFILIKVFFKKKNSDSLAGNKFVPDNDTKKVLKVIDDLLNKLPEKESEKFSKTKNAELYSSVLKKYGIK